MLAHLIKNIHIHQQQCELSQMKRQSSYGKYSVHVVYAASIKTFIFIYPYPRTVSEALIF